MTISLNGRRPKTPEEQEQGERNVQQAREDLQLLKAHYGSWRNISSEWGVPKSTLEYLYKGRGKGVNAPTLAFVRSLVNNLQLEENYQELSKECIANHSRVLLLARSCGKLQDENEELRRKIDVLSVPE